MATTSPLDQQAFSIKKFKSLFYTSPARQFMSDMDIEQVRKAIEDKDILLLGQLYEILLHEQVTNENVIRDFVMTKNKILDGFTADAMSIEKRFVEAPRKERAEKAERKEQKKAEEILKKL